MPQHSVPTLEFEALGTRWWIELPGASNVDDIRAIVLARVATFQDDYSRFLPTSVIGRLNVHKSLENPTSELIDMLSFARDMYHVSNGVFNISVGGTLVNLGYGQGQESAKVDTDVWKNIRISSSKITIPSNVELDFGGFGKGWLIDELGRLLSMLGQDCFVINGGGDILVSSNEPIEFDLEHPTDVSKKIGTTRITTGALAVSSSIKRSWKQDDKTVHHIIDPRQGTSSHSRVISTYVKAQSALIADTMATILLIAPELDEKLTKQFDLQTILLDEVLLTS